MKPALGNNGIQWAQLFLRSMGVLGMMVAAVWWLSSQLHAQELVILRIEQQTKGAWTAVDMKLWTVQLDKQNDGLSVPDPWQVIERRPNSHGH